MTPIEWTPVDPLFVEPAADPDPPCPVGVEGHVWTLRVEEGGLSVDSGCGPCNASVDTEYLVGEVKGRLTFGQDHPDLGGWHGDVRCDCNWWIEFVPAGSG